MWSYSSTCQHNAPHLSEVSPDNGQYWSRRQVCYSKVCVRLPHSVNRVWLLLLLWTLASCPKPEAFLLLKGLQYDTSESIILSLDWFPARYLITLKTKIAGLKWWCQTMAEPIKCGRLSQMSGWVCGGPLFCNGRHTTHLSLCGPLGSISWTWYHWFIRMIYTYDTVFLWQTAHAI